MTQEMNPTFNAGHIENGDDLARLVGIFVARWSLAETCLMMPLIKATGITQEAATSMLSSVNSAESKILLVKNVVENSKLDFEKINSIKNSLKNFSALCAERNSMMHHMWMSSHEGEAYTVDYRKLAGSDKRKTLRSAEDIINLINRVADTAFGICLAANSPWITEKSCAALKIRTKD